MKMLIELAEVNQFFLHLKIMSVLLRFHLLRHLLICATMAALKFLKVIGWIITWKELNNEKFPT